MLPRAYNGRGPGSRVTRRASRHRSKNSVGVGPEEVRDAARRAGEITVFARLKRVNWAFIACAVMQDSMSCACVMAGSGMLQIGNCAVVPPRPCCHGMNADRLAKHWRRTLRDVLARIRKHRSRASLNAEAVHSARIALRRARLLLLVGRPQLKKTKIQVMRRRARQLLDALGPVRDCDVALEWLACEASTQPLRRAIQRLRLRDWHLARRQLKRRPPPLRLPAKRPASAALARRWQRLLAITQSRCRELLRHPLSLDTAQLHELRRAIRRWRYLLELTVHRQDPVEAGRVRELVKTQEILGAAQNLAATAETLARLRETPGIRPWQLRLQRAQRQAVRRATSALARQRQRLEV